MMYKIWPFLLALACIVGLSGSASAQIGPDLRPPGLAEGHPVDSYSVDGSKRAGNDWLYAENWELNASDVVFSASKKRQLLSEAPSTIHVITDKQIDSHGWRTLSEILRHVPGVQTLTAQSQFQSVMIRGLVGTESNNSRILWLQNGVPFNDVRDSGVWIDETYPVELIKRIEVVLGPGSALYGSGAFQGVINIFTKDPKDIPKYGEYRLALGLNTSVKASATAAYMSETSDFGILVHAAGNTTQGPALIGDYVYEKKLMTQAGNSVSNSLAPNSHDPSAIDPNSDKHWYGVDMKLNYKQFKLAFSFTDIYAGADGSEIVPNVAYRNDVLESKDTGDGFLYSTQKAQNYRFNRREFSTELIYEDRFLDNLSFTALLSYRFNQYRTQNYGGYSKDGDNIVRISYSGYEPIESTINTAILTDYPSNFNKKIDFNTLQHKLYGLAQIQWRIYEQNELITGLVMEYHNIEAPEFNYLTKDTKHQYVTPSIFLQDEQRFFNNRLILTAGARVDFYKVDTEQRDIAPSWRFAALVKWTDWMTQRVSYGYSFKEPSLFQLYVDMVDYSGNKLLKPETLHNVELSTLFTPWYFLSLRLDAYATLMSNLITMDWDPSFKSKNDYLGISGKYVPNQNSGANIFGFEFSVDAKISNNWSLYGHYNFLYSMRTYKKGETGVDKKIKDDAMHRGRLGASYLNEHLSADMALFLVSGSPKINELDLRTKQSKSGEPTFYAILQPHITVRLPADFGLLLQASYAFSNGMTQSPSYRYYYESRGIPVSRYSALVSLVYPFKGSK